MLCIQGIAREPESAHDHFPTSVLMMRYAFHKTLSATHPPLMSLGIKVLQFIHHIGHYFLNIFSQNGESLELELDFRG